MKKKLTALLLLLITTTAGAADFADLQRQALRLTEEKKYTQALELVKSAFLIRPGNASNFYNAACIAALADEKDLAFEWLNLSFDKGMHNTKHVIADTDLANLHDDARWKPMIEHFKSVIAEVEKNYNKPLQEILLNIQDTDQADREMVAKIVKKYGDGAPEVKQIWQKIELNDRVNTEKIKAIIQQYGWVGPDKVGPKASRVIFLVLQHADEDTRRQYLPLMREAVNKKQAYSFDLALMEDRAAMEVGQKQIYGSQLVADKSGQITLHPLDDPEHVDERRASMGLPPLADYLKNWNLMWDVDVYKKFQYVKPINPK